jgi:L-alanine-DL-glutamate epimerase-like enolase superfamily enzyme
MNMEHVKITDIRLMRLDQNKTVGYWNLIRVDSSEGVWGLGESYWGPGLRDVIEEILKPFLVGQNPLDVDRLFVTIRDRLAGIHTQNGLIMAALSGIEIALWDLAGKLTGLPVYRLLGGKFRDRVRLYRTGLPERAHELSGCMEWAARLKDEEGWTAIKTIDVDSMWQRYDPECREDGHEPLGRSLSEKDLKLAETIMVNLRKAFGDDYDIAVHCHWALDLRDAQRLAERMAPYNPIWLEDPLPVPFSPAWVRLTETSKVAICTGENLYGRYEFRPFIEEHGTDIVHIDVPKSGGLLETKRIADMADLHYLKTAFHNPASVVGTIASVHVAAAIRNFTMIERAGADHPWWEDVILHDGPVIRNGYIAVPQKPGLGIELNPDVVRPLVKEGDTYWGP